MGKPLIGDAQMLALHQAMVQLRALDQPPASHSQSGAVQRVVPDIALLAAALLQLRPGDVLVAGEDSALQAETLVMAQEATFTPEHQATRVVARGENAAMFAAGHAFAQARTTRAGDDAPVTVALLPPGQHRSGAFAEALRLAGQAVLPLIVIVQDGPAARAATIPSMENVEVVRVDASDAVACCRVMQESLLRARNRWGCVVLQALHLPGEVDPVVAFEGHLRRRGLQF